MNWGLRQWLSDLPKKRYLKFFLHVANQRRTFRHSTVGCKLNQKSVPSRSLASFSSCIKVCWSSWLRTSSWWSHLTDLTGLLLFLGEEQEPFLAEEAKVPAVVDAAAETFFGCLEDWAAAALWLPELDDDEQWQVEKPLKKQTEHWMAMAPSDFRSNVADCCKIIVIFLLQQEELSRQHCAHN